MNWTSQDVWIGCLLFVTFAGWAVNRLTGWLHKERNPKAFWWVYGASLTLWAMRLLWENW